MELRPTRNGNLHKEGSVASYESKGLGLTTREEQPTCSVIIPLKNDASYIAEQLSALEHQTFSGWWEVIIADNGSTDGSVEIARQWSSRLPNLRVVDASGRAGSAYARNIGTYHAKGELIAYCDADDVVGRHWLEALAICSLRHGIVAGRQDDTLLNPPANQVHSPTREPRADLEGFRFLPWTFGGNIAVWREAFDAVDGWDEKYIHMQDMDFCWRVQLAGFSWGYAPDAVVHYRHRGTLYAHAKQRFRWGHFAPVLYADYRQYGFPPESGLQLLRGWYWLITRVPFLVLGAHRRRFWVRRAADRLGRLVGSVRHRSWYGW